MAKNIFFSPVGGTDPVSQDNFRDGSLIHIIRNYDIDVVYLYMSKEMLELQDKDDRYRYCINRLAEMKGKKIEIYEIERNELESVHQFDFFYQDFSKCIQEIITNNSLSDSIYLNVSSGTPAMKSGLLVLATLGEYNYKMIQVSTPTKKMNNHNHDNYDVVTLWELNEDNGPNAINRCEEVKCPSLSVIKQEEIIKQLIREYDYKAAMIAAEKLPSEVSANYYKLIKIAYYRLQLDRNSLIRLKKECSISGFPITQDEAFSCFEYALNIDIKRRKGDYADFVRAISPLIVDIYKLILKHEFKIDISRYTSVDSHNILRWSEKGLQNSKIEKVLFKRWPNFKKNTPVAAVHLLEIILCESNNKKLNNSVQSLREVEEKVRNIAAHQIVSISDESIKKFTGYSSDEVMEKIKQCFLYTGLNIKKEYWNAYDEMNDSIIDTMESKV